MNKTDDRHLKENQELIGWGHHWITICLSIMWIMWLKLAHYLFDSVSFMFAPRCYIISNTHTPALTTSTCILFLMKRKQVTFASVIYKTIKFMRTLIYGQKIDRILPLCLHFIDNLRVCGQHTLLASLIGMLYNKQQF